MNLELNSKIATHIFGWEEIAGDEIARRGFSVFTRDPVHCLIFLEDPGRGAHLKRMWVSGEEVRGCEECCSLPDWSGELEEAWRVVEHLASHDPANHPPDPVATGYWLRLQSPFEADSKTWNAGFTQHSFTGWSGRPDFQGQGDTAAEAICRAALKIVGGHEAVPGDPLVPLIDAK